MEAPPLDVGAEDYPHLVADVVVAALVARDDEPRGIPALCEREHEGERGGMAHAARNEEIPASAAPRGIGGK